MGLFLDVIGFDSLLKCKNYPINFPVHHTSGYLLARRLPRKPVADSQVESAVWTWEQDVSPSLTQNETSGRENELSHRDAQVRPLVASLHPIFMPPHVRSSVRPAGNPAGRPCGLSPPSQCDHLKRKTNEDRHMDALTG